MKAPQSRPLGEKINELNVGITDILRRVTLLGVAVMYMVRD